MGKKINASPTKGFFVNMLTRDIDLDDAILDLLDNSLDGLLRIADCSAGIEKPYDGYEARITIKDDLFIIEDNCGGIPTKIAEDYAFRMGRPTEREDDEIPTVGMYGIGMKRAVFKIGQNIEFITFNEDDHHYDVKINESWLASDSWNLDLNDKNEDKLSHRGTKIIITELYSGIKAKFSNDSGFLSDLIKKISSHYLYIIKKGFKVYVNDKPVVPVNFDVLMSSDIDDKNKILPYIFEDEIDGVTIQVLVGLREQSPTPDEENEEAQSKINKSTNAGWTIICNDRVVLFADRSRVTGWGDGLPQFHYQFNSLVGIVTFKSNKATNLPVTTTKRGIDASSDIYLRVRRRMIDGMRIFIDYTNKWKNLREVEKNTIINHAEKKNVSEAITFVKEKVTLNKVNDGAHSKQYRPTLPLPVTSVPTKSIIRFYKEKKEIEIVSEFLLSENEKNASIVGESCFDYVLSEATK